MSEQSAAMNAALQRCKTTFKVFVFRSRTTEQVLFLEAGNDFVDTLFSFLLLPIGTILDILSRGISEKPNFCGISRILESVDPSILLLDKRDLVQPRPAVVGCNCEANPDLQVQRDLEAAGILRRTPPKRLVLPQDYFRCTRGKCSSTFISSDRGERCEQCKSDNYTGHFRDGPYMAVKKDVKESSPLRGFVKANIKFIVTDQLEIKPSTPRTIMSVLKKTEVASVGDPESTEIVVSITQILQLLHSALTSNTCLNDVF